MHSTISSLSILLKWRNTQSPIRENQSIHYLLLYRLLYPHVFSLASSFLKQDTQTDDKKQKTFVKKIENSWYQYQIWFLQSVFFSLRWKFYFATLFYLSISLFHWDLVTRRYFHERWYVSEIYLEELKQLIKVFEWHL